MMKKKDLDKNWNDSVDMANKQNENMKDSILDNDKKIMKKFIR